MAVVGELLVLMAGNNAPLLGSIATSEAALRGFSGTTGTHASATAGHVSLIGAAALGVVGAVGIMGVAGVRAAGDFQEQMGIINTIAHLTPAQLDKVGDSIKGMSQQTGQPLQEMTGAFYDLLSAGVPVEKAMSVMHQASTLAIGGLATMPQTVDLLTTAMNAYHLNAKGSAKATDEFALAVQDGKVTAAEIASTFAGVAPVAKNMGVGIDEISASYAVLTARGTQAPEAMTQMTRAMVELQKPNAALNDLQEKTHLNFAKIAGEKGLVVALETMREAAEKNHVPFQDLFGRLEGMNFALATTGPNFKAYADELTKMHSSTGTASDQAAERMGTFNRQVDILGTSLNNAFISASDTALPAITGIVASVSGAVQGFTAWSEKNPGLAANILLVAGAVAAVIAGVVFLGPIIGALATAIGVIASPIVLIVGGLAALAAHFGLLGDGAKDAVDGILGKVGELAQGFLAWISPMIPVALDALGRLGSQIIGWIGQQAPGWMAQLAQWAGAFIDWVSPMVPKVLAALGDLAARAIGWVAAEAPKWVTALLHWADQFLAWIGPLVPKLLSALGQLGATLIGWVIGEVPVVVGAIGRMAIAFVQWVLPKIPELLGLLLQFGVALLGWVASQIPVLTAAVLKWVAAFIGWIGNSIPEALASLGRWIGQVLAWMNGVTGQFLKAATDWGGSIVKGVMDAVAGLPGKVGDMLSQIPGVKLLGDAGGAVGGALNGLPHFATGGVVPGSPGSAQLVVAHGGETITPHGGGGTQVMEHHTHVHLGGDEIADVVERILLRNGSAFSSGFVADGSAF